jgi:hypothetical protein
MTFMSSLTLHAFLKPMQAGAFSSVLLAFNTVIPAYATTTANRALPPYASPDRVAAKPSFNFQRVVATNASLSKKERAAPLSRQALRGRRHQRANNPGPCAEKCSAQRYSWSAEG